MSPAEMALTRKGWRWMPGSLATPGGPQHDADRYRLDAERVRVTEATAAGGPCGAPEGWLPDLQDPATLGCLAALVMETAGPACPITIAYHPDADPGDGSGWAVEVGDRMTRGHLGAALVAALRASW